MNIHPIFTHFPVALLTVYSLLECLQFKKLSGQAYWFFVKASFVIIGTVSSFATYATGTLIEDQFEVGQTARLLEVHAGFATATVIIFSLISLLYLVAWLDTTAWVGRYRSVPAVATLLKIKNMGMVPAIIIPMAILGLVVITITGALGGALVYGPDIDPVVSFIYGLFFSR